MHERLVPAPECHERKCAEPHGARVVARCDLCERVERSVGTAGVELRLGEQRERGGPILVADGQQRERAPQFFDRNFGDVFRNRLPRLGDKRRRRGE